MIVQANAEAHLSTEGARPAGRLQLEPLAWLFRRGQHFMGLMTSSMVPGQVTNRGGSSALKPDRTDDLVQSLRQEVKALQASMDQLVAVWTMSTAIDADKLRRAPQPEPQEACVGSQDGAMDRRHEFLEAPFDTIESAQEYVDLLLQTIEETRGDVGEQIDLSLGRGEERRVQALQLVALNLGKLSQYLTKSRRTLNDLRTLRRLLLRERTQARIDLTEQPQSKVAG